MTPKDDQTVVPFQGCSDGLPIPRFTPKGYGEFSTAPPLSWIIKGILPRAELVIIYGESGCGKSFMALNMGLSIARGLAWHEHKSKPGRVVYVCAESPQGFKGRVRAYAERHGLSEDDFANFQIVDESPNFIKDLDPTLLGAAIGHADVIFIDTLARVTAGADENSGYDMGAVLLRCQALHRATGAVIVLIHHSGKDSAKGSRGWSGMRAGADTEIFVEKCGNGNTATITKQKDGADDIKWAFSLLPYTLGVDEDGDEITSCTYESSDHVPEERTKERKLGGWQAAVMANFERTIKGESNSFVLEEVLIRLTVDNSPQNAQNGTDRRPEQIRRALLTLITKNILHIVDGKVYKKQ